MTSRADVSVLGLGAMGAPIAQNLVRSGLTVEVWNRSPGAIVELVQLGATPLAAASDSTAEWILTVFTDLGPIEELLGGAPLGPGTKVVVMSTSDPKRVARLGREFEKRGVELMDAPMSGGDHGAKAGNLSLFVGARPETFERFHELVIGRIASSAIHFGGVGLGSTAKLLNQMVVAATLNSLAEAIVLGESFGVDTADLLLGLGFGLADSSVLRAKAQRLIDGDFVGGGSIANQVKDLRYAMGLARGAGLSLPLLQAVTREYREALAVVDPSDDHSAILEYLRQTNATR